jgi:thiamine monophosphate kinase
MNLNLRLLTESFEDRLDLALNGGEDFQLLFTISKSKVASLTAGLIGEEHHGLFVVIGETTSNLGTIELLRNEKTEVIVPSGYQHF